MRLFQWVVLFSGDLFWQVCSGWICLIRSAILVFFGLVCVSVHFPVLFPVSSFSLSSLSIVCLSCNLSVMFEWEGKLKVGFVIVDERN